MLPRARAAPMLLLLAVAALGCPQPPPPPDAGSDLDAGTNQLPCEVVTVLDRACAHCHSRPPAANAPVALLGRLDFTARSAGPDSETLGARSVARLNDPGSPMPPASEPPLPSEDRAVLERWVADGMPEGDCAPLPDRPRPTTCASQQFWNETDGDDARMAPGQACRQCHLLVAPDRAYFFMGTVFPSFHEEDNCESPAPADAVVEILDASGTVRLTLAPNSVGNFTSSTVEAGFPLPYTARVRANGRVRAMRTPQTNGDCNSCHTEQGAQNAPGRIVWP